MNDHYFSSKPTSKSDSQKIIANLRGNSVHFLSDSGVFSKKGIDMGSRILIETVHLENVHTLLDLGCGYGPIGISLAKSSPNIEVTMVDINERAVELAKINAEKNGVIDRMRIVQSDGFSQVEGVFDSIVTNPPIRIGKQRIYEFFEQARNFLNPGGNFWVVIRKQQGAASAKKKLEELYDDVQVVRKEKGYWIIVANYY